MLKNQLFILLMVYFICETALLILNHHNIRKNSNHNPFKDFLDEEAFSKSREIYVGKDATMSVHFTKE